jgi:hypothetical protein
VSGPLAAPCLRPPTLAAAETASLTLRRPQHRSAYGLPGDGRDPVRSPSPFDRPWVSPSSSAPFQVAGPRSLPSPAGLPAAGPRSASCPPRSTAPQTLPSACPLGGPTSARPQENLNEQVHVPGDFGPDATHVNADACRSSPDCLLSCRLRCGRCRFGSGFFFPPPGYEAWLERLALRRGRRHRPAPGAGCTAPESARWSARAARLTTPRVSRRISSRRTRATRAETSTCFPACSFPVIGGTGSRSQDR